MSKNKRKTEQAFFEQPVIANDTEDPWLQRPTGTPDSDKPVITVDTDYAVGAFSERSHSVPVTIFLIAVSVALSFLLMMGSSTTVLTPLLIAAPESHGFQDVLSGEAWRLITPIFLHFGPLHLLFNMLWLWDLGSMMERKKGHLFVFEFVLGVGITANIAQYLITGSPFFGGMSGVVYGFLGYIWIQGRYNADFGVVLRKQTVVMMLIWFVLCWFGIFGPIANWAHTFGLGMGIVLGCYSFDSRSQGVRGGLRVAAGMAALVVVFYVAVMSGLFMSGMGETFVSNGDRVYSLDKSISINAPKGWTLAPNPPKKDIKLVIMSPKDGENDEFNEVIYIDVAALSGKNTFEDYLKFTHKELLSINQTIEEESNVELDGHVGRRTVFVDSEMMMVKGIRLKIISYDIERHRTVYRIHAMMPESTFDSWQKQMDDICLSVKFH